MIGGIEAIHAWTPPSGPVSTGLVNRVSDSTMELGVTGWSDTGAGVTVNILATTEAWKAYGSKALEYKATNSSGSLKNAGVTTAQGTSGMPVLPGEEVTAKVRANFISHGGSLIGHDLLIIFYDAAGVAVGFPETPDSLALGEQTLELTATAPEKAAFAAVRARISSVPNGGVVHFMLDMGMFVEGDGKVPDFPTPDQIAKGLIQWAGAENGSASTLLGPVIELGRKNSDFGEPVWPRFKLRRISGLRSQGVAEDNKSAKIGGIGENPEPSERRGKSVVYEGTIEAESLLQLREAEDTLLAAFADISAVGRMDVTWHPDNAEFAGQTPKFYEAKCLTCEIPDGQETKGWKRLFVVGLWMYDPRHFDEETESHTVEIANTNVFYRFT